MKTKYIYAVLVIALIAIVSYFYYNKQEFLDISDIENEIKSGSRADVEHFNDYFLKGRAFEDAAFYEDAYKMYKKALIIRKDDYRIKLLLSRLELQILGKNEEAENRLASLERDVNIGKIEGIEERSDVYNQLGILQYGKNNLSSAIDYFNQAIKSGREVSDSYYNLGRVFFKKGEYEKALPYFTSARKLSPLFIDAMVYEGIVLLKNGDFKRCSDVFNDINVQNLNRRESYTYGAYCYYKIGAVIRSSKLIDILFLLDPYYMTKIQKNMDVLKTVEDIDYEIKLLTDIGDTLKNRNAIALLTYIKGDKENARAMVKTKNDVSSINLLALFDFFNNNFLDAGLKFNSVFAGKANYDNPVAHLYLAKLKFQKNLYNEALAHINKVKSSLVEMRSITLEAVILEGDIAYSSNIPKEALSKWNSVLTMDKNYIPAMQRKVKVEKILK